MLINCGGSPISDKLGYTEENMAEFVIPVLAPKMPKPERDYPISERENLMRAFRHEKPIYMPFLYQATQWYMPKAYGDFNRMRVKDGVDWFGTHYQYEETQEGMTPVPPYVMEEILDWRDVLHFPDLKSMDWGPDNKEFVRDENLALACRCLWHGTFESLHFFEGFQQALVDLVSEPEECHEFFERMTDFKIDMLNLQAAHYDFDYVCHNDDWSTAKSQMFSRRPCLNRTFVLRKRHGRQERIIWSIPAGKWKYGCLIWSMILRLMLLRSRISTIQIIFSKHMVIN